MKVSLLILLKAIVCVVFGVAYIVWPVGIAGGFDVALSPGGAFMARLFGVVFFGIGLYCWLIRNHEGKALKDFVFAFFIADTIGLIVALIAQLDGIMNDLGWLLVALWLFFSVGLGYFFFKKQAV